MWKRPQKILEVNRLAEKNEHFQKWKISKIDFFKNHQNHILWVLGARVARLARFGPLSSPARMIFRLGKQTMSFNQSTKITQSVTSIWPSCSGTISSAKSSEPDWLDWELIEFISRNGRINSFFIFQKKMRFFHFSDFFGFFKKHLIFQMLCDFSQIRFFGRQMGITLSEWT